MSRFGRQTEQELLDQLQSALAANDKLRQEATAANSKLSVAALVHTDAAQFMLSAGDSLTKLANALQTHPRGREFAAAEKERKRQARIAERVQRYQRVLERGRERLRVRASCRKHRKQALQRQLDEMRRGDETNPPLDVAAAVVRIRARVDAQQLILQVLDERYPRELESLRDAVVGAASNTDTLEELALDAASTHDSLERAMNRRLDLLRVAELERWQAGKTGARQANEFPFTSPNPKFQLLAGRPMSWILSREPLAPFDVNDQAFPVPDAFDAAALRPEEPVPWHTTRHIHSTAFAVDAVVLCHGIDPCQVNDDVGNLLATVLSPTGDMAIDVLYCGPRTTQGRRTWEENWNIFVDHPEDGAAAFARLGCASPAQAAAVVRALRSHSNEHRLGWRVGRPSRRARSPVPLDTDLDGCAWTEMDFDPLTDAERALFANWEHCPRDGPSLDTELTGSAWRLLPLDVVATDEPTEEQVALIATRATHGPLSATQMARRRNRLAKYFAKRTHNKWSGHDVPPEFLTETVAEWTLAAREDAIAACRAKEQAKRDALVEAGAALTVFFESGGWPRLATPFNAALKLRLDQWFSSTAARRIERRAERAAGLPLALVRSAQQDLQRMEAVMKKLGPGQ